MFTFCEPLAHKDFTCKNFLLEIFLLYGIASSTISWRGYAATQSKGNYKVCKEEDKTEVRSTIYDV